MKKTEYEHGRTMYDKQKCRCTICTKANTEYNYEYRQRNKLKLRRYKRKYNKLWRKENGYHNERNSIARYPEKQKARLLLYQAIRRGVVVRGLCEVPGCNSKKSHGHHDDYSKPLEVRWLCPLHHKEVHMRMVVK